MLPTKGAKRQGLYAAPPGTGPAGKTCGDCAFLRYTGNIKKHPKCGATKYTHGDATTIKTRTPACRSFIEAGCPCGEHEGWWRRADTNSEGMVRPITDPMEWYNPAEHRAGAGVPPCVDEMLRVQGFPT